MENTMRKEIENWIIGKVGAAVLLSDEELDELAEKKLRELLKKRPEGYTRKEFAEITKAIKKFIGGDETDKLRLAAYCAEYPDPTDNGRVIIDYCEHKTVIIGGKGNTVKVDNAGFDGKRKSTAARNEEIRHHRFLREDEYTKLYEFVKRHGSDGLFGLKVHEIRERHGMESPQVYRNASMSRQDFSRVTSTTRRNVTRHIAWQIIIGLECSLEEADEVLFSAGYKRRNSYFDLIMQYFIEKRIYDVMAINFVLEAFDLKPFPCYTAGGEKR